MNAAIRGALELHNNTKLLGRPHSRRELFEEVELPAIQPLPAMPFEFKRQQNATVAINCYVCLKEDKHYYSIPYKYIGKKVKLMYSLTQVEIYYNYALLTIHPWVRKLYGYTYDPDHLASTHKYLTEWNPERFIRWAESIDESVRVFIAGLMESKFHPEHSHKACQGVLGYERKVGRKRLINACIRAMELDNYSYHAIRSILENK